MKENKIEILPHEGMPSLRFGVSTDKAGKVLGDPPETELIEEHDEFFTPTLIWHYPQNGLSLFFEGDDHLLASMESDNHETILFGKEVFRLGYQEIITLMKSKGFEDYESETETWGEERLSFSDALMDFYFERDRLSTVDWGIIPE